MVNNTSTMPKYRDWLKEELEERRARNPGYSLRAFCRDIGISHAQLSKTLAGKENISLKAAQFIAALAFSDNERRDAFPWLVLLETVRTPAKKKIAMDRLASLLSTQKSYFIKIDEFETISKWYHLAILDLSTLASFQSDPVWIAEYLGITGAEAKSAVDRLMRLGLLVNEGGRFRKSSATVQTKSEKASEAIRAYHRQMIDKAVDSIDGQSMDQRHLVGLSFSLCRADLNEVITILSRARTDIKRLSARTDAPDALYQLNMQLFDLRKKK